MNEKELDEKTMNKIQEIQSKMQQNDPENKIPFGLKLFMVMGEFAQYLSEGNKNNE